MPYNSWSDAPPHVKKRGRKKAEQWVAVWNSAYDRTKEEAKAFAAANSSIASSMSREAITTLASDVFKEATAQNRYTVEYIRSGYWADFNGEGEMFVTNEDIADGIETWRSWREKEASKEGGENRRVFLDWNHGITRPELSHKPNEAAGWMVDAWIEDMAGATLEPDEARTRSDTVKIKALYEVVGEAAEAIDAKTYTLFSPTFITSGKHGGEEWKFEIVGGAMTNIPFFNGMDGYARAATWGAAKALLVGQVALAESWIRIKCPKGGEDLEKKLCSLEEMGFEVESFYQGPKPDVAMAQGKNGDGDDDGSDVVDKKKEAEVVVGNSIEWVDLTHGFLKKGVG
jgi:hypothetical protein